MLMPVSGTDLSRIRHLYTTPHSGLVFRSVEAGHTRAEVWANGEGTASLMWEGHGLFFVGDPGSDDFAAGLPAVLAEIARRADAGGMRWIKLNCGEGWTTAVTRLIPDTFSRDRTLYSRAPTQPDHLALPGGYTHEPIDAAMLLEGRFGGAEGVIEEIRYMWPSVERFLEVGFGRAVCHEGEVACWCTSEYISQGQCGIGIETSDAHRRLGLAAAAATAFVGEAGRRGWVSHWDCWTDNVGSMRVAQRAGFTVLERYTVQLADVLRVQR